MLVKVVDLLASEIGSVSSAVGVAAKSRRVCLSPRCGLSSICGVFGVFWEMEVLGLPECLRAQEKKSSLS